MVLPLAVPGLIVGAVLVFTGSFTSYATPQLLGGERQMMMGTFLYQQAMVTFDWVARLDHRRDHDRGDAGHRLGDVAPGPPAEPGGG